MLLAKAESGGSLVMALGLEHDDIVSLLEFKTLISKSDRGRVLALTLANDEIGLKATLLRSGLIAPSANIVIGRSFQWR
jgi:hypothetical protein